MVPNDTRAYFTSATSIIAIPTAIKLLNWLGTLYSGCYWLITPLFFIIGFLFSFSFGGFSGLILANCIIDSILHDTYFVVGHFHYVLSLGAVYSTIATIYNYSIFISSCPYSDYLGRIHYILFFISSNLLFLPMHAMGIFNLPRRIFDYPIVFQRIQWLCSAGFIGILISMMLYSVIML